VIIKRTEITFLFGFGGFKYMIFFQFYQQFRISLKMSDKRFNSPIFDEIFVDGI